MGRIPPVERCALTGGLTMESAALWYYFLAEEADFEGDIEKCKKVLQRAEDLTNAPQGYIHSKYLEDEIKKWKVNT